MAEEGWAGEVQVALLSTLPYIVVIVDELADMMMMTVGKKVCDQEVHKVVAYLKSRGVPEYVEAVVSGDDETGAEDPVAELESGGEADALYAEAVRFVTETRRASVSGVQRRLKIGYNRAARMVEEMERQGMVGSLQSNGFREVLVRPPPAD